MSASSFFVSSDIQKVIRETFYNYIFEYVFPQDDLTPDNLPLKLHEAVEHMIRAILMTSASCPGIRLPNGRIITTDNCPPQYQDFFWALLTLKSDAALNEDMISVMASQILTMESFQSLNPGQFILEAKGWAIAAPRYEEYGVTLELIRTTFYNEMVTQTRVAVENGWLTVSDLETQKPEIYFVLPALTIATAIQKSQDQIQKSQDQRGLRLLDRKILTQNNCPAEAKSLVEPILALQSKLTSVTDEHFLLIKQRLASDSDMGADNTTELVLSFKAIKGTAIAITQKRSFHEMVPLVIDAYLDSLQSSSSPSI